MNIKLTSFNDFNSSDDTDGDVVELFRLKKRHNEKRTILLDFRTKILKNIIEISGFKRLSKINIKNYASVFIITPIPSFPVLK